MLIQKSKSLVIVSIPRVSAPLLFCGPKLEKIICEIIVTVSSWGGCAPPKPPRFVQGCSAPPRFRHCEYDVKTRCVEDCVPTLNAWHAVSPPPGISASPCQRARELGSQTAREVESQRARSKSLDIVNIPIGKRSKVKKKEIVDFMLIQKSKSLVIVSIPRVKKGRRRQEKQS